VCVVTDAFTGQAQYQAEILSLQQPPVAYVRHPVSNASPGELIGKAEESFEVVASSLRQGPQPMPAWAEKAGQGCSS